MKLEHNDDGNGDGNDNDMMMVCYDDGNDNGMMMVCNDDDNGHGNGHDAKQERDDTSYHAQIFKNELIATSQKVEKMDKDVREN